MVSLFSSISLARTYPLFNQSSCDLVEWLAEKIDSYFDLGQGQTVFITKEKNTIFYLKRSSRFRMHRPGSLECTLKIISYLLVVPLLIALIFKCVVHLILHFMYRFEKYVPVPSDDDIITGAKEIMRDFKQGVKGLKKTFVSGVKSLTNKRSASKISSRSVNSQFVKLPGMRNGYGFR
ncbi:DUF648 domain-containing protein [Candidatus Chlamydia corallus]|uniref:DUF648 domain-containing protein n=1 Tax=Candidatus Chlamydia corallus TaxID=2038470 RepID=UPI000C2FBE0E